MDKCVYCGHAHELSDPLKPVIGVKIYGWICADARACRRRRQKAEEERKLNHPNLDLYTDAHLRESHIHTKELLHALQVADRMGDANGEDCFDAAEALDRLISIAHRRGVAVEKQSLENA